MPNQPPENSAPTHTPQAPVRVARIDPKVRNWTVLVVVVVTVMMFAALIVHGMILSNRIQLWQ